MSNIAKGNHYIDNPAVDMSTNNSYLSDKREIMAFAQEAVNDFM